MNDVYSGDLPIGCLVFSADGHRLGQIKEVREPFFKIDAPMALDYWVSRTCVAEARTDGIVLAVEQDDIDDAKVDPDDFATTDEPAPAVIREGLLTGSVPPDAPVGLRTDEAIVPEPPADFVPETPDNPAPDGRTA